MRLLSLFSPHLVLSAVLLTLGCTAVANADVIHINVVNGNFENVAVDGASNQLNYHVAGGTAVQQVMGWTSGMSGSAPGYNFVFVGSTASGDAYGQTYGTYGNLSLWGMQNGVANGIGASPMGGNFLGMDGAYQTATVSQQLTGLTVGLDTRVYFYYAGAQQYGYTGDTTEGFQVSLSDGNTTESHNTATLLDSSHGFTGWHYTSLDFTATNTTETLSFLAKGTPNGEPPFSLLDGVSVVQVTPEPSSILLMGTGLLTVAGLVRRRYNRA